MRHILLGSLVGVAALASAHSASAGVTYTTLSSYYDSLTNSTFTSAGTATSTSTPVSVGQFTATISLPSIPGTDPTYGTLQSISLSFAVVGSASALVNGNSGDAYSNIAIGIPFTLTSKVGSGAATQLVTGTGYADTAPGNGNASTVDGSGSGFSGTLASTGTSTVGTNSFSLPSSSYGTTISGSSNLAPYESGQTLSFKFTTGTNQNISGNIPQNDLEGGNSSEKVKVTLVETYALTTVDVPEPASMAVLGVGLIGAGLLRRRAK